LDSNLSIHLLDVLLDDAESQADTSTGVFCGSFVDLDEGVKYAAERVCWYADTRIAHFQYNVVRYFGVM
jgi:hypothetical protein